jgi:superfamily II DNA or RNA helicase
MDVIKIKNRNHSVLDIQCDWGIAQELSEFFSFFVPGYKYMPAYKNKVWDGKIRLFNIQTMDLPVGLYTYLQDFAKVRDYIVEVEDDKRYGSPSQKVQINPKNIMKFIEDEELTSRGQPISCRDYQFNAVCHALENKRAILLSPTGSGKSLIIYLLVKYWHGIINPNGRKKLLIVVPTTSLVEQMYEDFRDYGMMVENGVHKIYSGKDKQFNQGTVISTWQSIYKMPTKWFEQFGCVIGDECHGFKAKSLTTIMNKCTEANYRFGTSGTLDNTQTHELVLQGLFGKIFNVTTTKKLQEMNTLSALEINVLLLIYSKDIRKNWGKKDYHTELDYIVKYEPRNKFITNLALDLKGNSLILFQFVDKHGKPLHQMIKDKAGDGRKIFYVSGDTDTNDREQIRKIVENEENAVIVASLGTFSTGINIRNLHNIIFASPSKSQIRVLQSIGRGLRKSDDGRITTLYDVADDLHWKKNMNYTLNHSAERIKIYNREQFKYTIHKVDI